MEVRISRQRLCKFPSVSASRFDHSMSARLHQGVHITTKIVIFTASSQLIYDLWWEKGFNKSVTTRVHMRTSSPSPEAHRCSTCLAGKESYLGFDDREEERSTLLTPSRSPRNATTQTSRDCKRSTSPDNVAQRKNTMTLHLRPYPASPRIYVLSKPIFHLISFVAINNPAPSEGVRFPAHCQPV
jgi:hypothetical protein